MQTMIRSETQMSAVSHEIADVVYICIREMADVCIYVRDVVVYMCNHIMYVHICTYVYVRYAHMVSLY